MALVWAFSADLTGTIAPLVNSGWAFAPTSWPYAVTTIVASGRHPLSGYGGADYAISTYANDPYLIGYAYTPNPAFTALPDGIVGFHMWNSTNANVSFAHPAFEIYSLGTAVVKLVPDGLGYLDVSVHDGTSYALEFTTSILLPVSTSAYIAVRYKPGPSGAIAVYINGISAGSSTGSYHTGSWDRLGWHRRGMAGTRMIWMPTVWDAPATDPALTAVQWVAKITPDADATAGSWSASTGSDLYAMIDETTYSASDYVTTTTTPDDEYRCTGSWTTSINAAWAPAAINGVVGYAAVRGDSLLNASEIAWSSGGTAAHGTTTTTTSTVIAIMDTLAVNPNGSAAWTTTMLNTLQFGVKVS